jgi:hypothetical protein
MIPSTYWPWNESAPPETPSPTWTTGSIPTLRPPTSFHTIEVEQERRGREVLRLMLQAHIDSRGDGGVGDGLAVRPPSSSEEIVYRHKRLRSRRLVTVFGVVCITRRGYSSPGQNSIYPLDAVLGLPARSYSYEIQRRLVKAAAKGPFDEAIEKLADALGVKLSKRTAEQIVADASVDFDSFYEERSLRRAPESGPLLIASVDGKGVPMVKSAPGERKVRLARGEKRNKKRMSTVGAVFTQKANVRTPESVVESLFAESSVPHPKKGYHRPEQKRVWASLLLSKDAFIAQVQAEMRRRDPKRKKTWIVVIDGERALQRKVAATFQGIELILDLLHVLEKLWAVSYVANSCESVPISRLFVSSHRQEAADSHNEACGKAGGRPQQGSVTKMAKRHLGGPLEFCFCRTICCLDGQTGDDRREIPGVVV